MTRWLRCFWDEEAVWFYFELDTDGFVIRQVELQEPGNKALAAASLVEWQEAQGDGRLAEYESVYGLTAELPISEWEGTTHSGCRPMSSRPFGRPPVGSFRIVSEQHPS